MSALADPFIRYVLAQDNDLTGDVRRDIEDGWTFNPDRIPGTVALLYRMHQLDAGNDALEAYWSVLAEYIRERPYDAVEAMQILAESAAFAFPVREARSPIVILLSELEDDGDWVSVC
jgi:hypothetical protein